MQVLPGPHQRSRRVDAEKCISNRKYPIYEGQDPVTGEVYVRKVIETKDESVADLLKRHLNENVLSYFRRRDRCTLLDVAPQCIEVLASKNTPGTLYVSRVFIRGKSLRELLKNNSAMVARRHIGFMARQMLSILLDYGGHTDWIMTLDNLFVDSCGSIKPNYTSFVGLAFLKLNQSIRLEEFAEIYPYLDHRTIAKETGRMIDRQLQIRSLAVNLLAILIGRDLRLQPKASHHDMTPKLAESDLKNIGCKFQSLLFTLESELQANPVEEGERYLRFIRAILIDQVSQDWDDVIKILFREDVQARVGDIGQLKLQQNYLIGQEGQLRQEESQMGQEESQISQENSKIIADEFSNLLRSFEKESDTDFNKYHQLHTDRVLVPLSIGMEINDVIRCGNWVVVFMAEEESRSETLQAAYSLVKLVLQVEDSLREKQQTYPKLETVADHIRQLRTLRESKKSKNTEDHLRFRLVVQAMWLLMKHYFSRVLALAEEQEDHDAGQQQRENDLLRRMVTGIDQHFHNVQFRITRALLRRQHEQENAKYS